jgi:hypothetical protein
VFQAVFQRYPRPEKEYQSFSLIHSNDERSLDLVSFLSLLINTGFLKLHGFLWRLLLLRFLWRSFTDSVPTLPPFHVQICKDKDEAEVWFVGLKALVSRAQLQKPRFEFKIGGPVLDVSSQYSLHTSNSSPLTSPFGSTESLHQVCFSTFTSHSSLANRSL